MRTPKARLTVGVAALIASTALAVMIPAAAQAAPSGDTTVTFTLTGGALDITVPVTADLGNATTAAGTLAGQLGAVTVTDARGQLVATWVATVTSTDFTTGAATTAETVPNSDVSYWSGAATATTGTGTFTPGQAAAGNAVVLSAPRTAFSKTAGAGNNSATWNPTLIVTIPAASVAGDYSGTVTHSVA